MFGTIKEPKAMPPKLITVIKLPKVGFTSNFSKLPNSLTLDFEDAATRYGGNYEVFTGDKQTQYEKFVSVLKDMETYRKENKIEKHILDFVILDNITFMESLMEAVGLIEYRKTPQGRDYSGRLSDLAWGQGAEFEKKAIVAIVRALQKYAKCVIAVTHQKLSSSKIGSDAEVSVNDLQASNKVRLFLTSDADAIGIFARTKPGLNSLTFETSATDPFIGSRIPELSNKRFTVSETLKDGTIKENFDFLTKLLI